MTSARLALDTIERVRLRRPFDPDRIADLNLADVAATTPLLPHRP
jgi:hypothetical protein